MNLCYYIGLYLTPEYIKKYLMNLPGSFEGSQLVWLRENYLFVNMNNFL